MAEDVIAEFLLACYENLDRLDVDLVDLERDPHDAPRLASAFRTIHTIKGAAGFLGYRRLETLTHAGENLLSKMRDGSLVLDQEVATALLRLGDAVRTILPHIEAERTEPEVDHTDVIANLARLLEPRAALAASAAPVVESHAPIESPAPPADSPTPMPASTVDTPHDDRRAGADRRAPIADTALPADVGL